MALLCSGSACPWPERAGPCLRPPRSGDSSGLGMEAAGKFSGTRLRQEPALATITAAVPSLSPGPGCHAAGVGWAVPGAAGPREAAPGPLLFVEEKQTRWRWPSPSALRWCEGAASGCEIPATFHGHPRSMHNMFRTKDQRGWLNRTKTHRTWTPGSGLVWASMSGKHERGVEP